MSEELIKVAFVHKTGEDEYETETMWCTKQGENFVLNNIPFVVYNISSDDVFTSEFDEEEQRYYFDSLVARSGNTTVRIFFYDNNNIEPTRQWLNQHNCESEALLARNTVAVNIPKDVDYTLVKGFLDKGELESKWSYEESCLMHDY